MNDKDIKLFVKFFVYGLNGDTATQTKRDPVELETKEIKGKSLFERIEPTLENIEHELQESLSSFVKQIAEVRESDRLFTEQQIAEEQRQRKLLEGLKIQA